MSMQKMTRLILGLRAAGLEYKAINDLMVFIGTGEEKYIPKPEYADGTIPEK